MTENQSNRKKKVWDNIIILISIFGLIICIAILFPQVRQMVLDFLEKVFHREISQPRIWLRTLLSYAMGSICLILLFDYCTLTDSGRALVKKVLREITETLSAIDFRSFLKPFILLTGIYLLGIFTIIQANFFYNDDVGWALSGHREWYNFSRYIIVFLAYLVQPEIRMTDISPLPQLLAVILLACSSILLVYILSNRKITTVRLLASIPLGLFPYFLECLSYKFMAPYFAFSVLICIIPFLFVAHRKAFFFSSVVAMLIMCMTYQAVSGVYLMIAVLLSFQDWNNKKKTNKEILSFLGIAALAFCFAMLFFRFFLMKSFDEQLTDYTSVAMLPLTQLLSGALINIKDYTLIVYHDLSLIWKAGILLVLVFFITRSMAHSKQKKIHAFFFSIIIIAISCLLSFGVYSLLKVPLFAPRALIGFCVFLSCICVYVASDYKKSAIITVLALNWCFFVFAFSYGNALTDQARYAEFRKNILLHDLSALQLGKDNENASIQFNNPIDYSPVVKNTAKHNPVIERLVPKRLGDFILDDLYCLSFNNYNQYRINFRVVVSKDYVDFNTLDLPLVLDSYYHTIHSDGEHILIKLKR